MPPPDLLLGSSREYGFFYVRNSGVSPKLVQQHFEQSHTFVQLPLDVKASLKDVRPSDKEVPNSQLGICENAMQHLSSTDDT